MAACNLTVELDEPNRPRVGGESVSGTVTVTTTQQIQCDGLEVASFWKTHGRGNIDQGDVDQQVVFQGQWEPEREYRYPFTVKAASWPPTYYGTLLNVSNGVRVRARIPWAKDPTVEAEFPVVATSAPEDLKPSEPTAKKSQSILGWVIGGIIIVIVLALLSVFLLFIIVPVGIVVVCWWFVRVFLPRQVTGSIEYTVEPKRVTSGDTIRGQLRFTPKRNMTINSIQWTVTCSEKCVSGSGSDRKTHHHEILQRSERLRESGELRAGDPQLIEFSFQVPPDAPPSLKFSDNELNWAGELRIDIAKWPDWVQKVPLTVIPSAEPGNAALPTVTADAVTTPATSAGEDWFYEVLRQVERCQNDPLTLRTVVSAVQGQVLTVCVDIVEQLEEIPRSAASESGTWRIAQPRRSDVEVALVWPPSDGAPPVGTQNWRGQAVILDFDEGIDCLLMRVVPGSR